METEKYTHGFDCILHLLEEAQFEPQAFYRFPLCAPEANILPWHIVMLNIPRQQITTSDVRFIT
jgi:hypothetical protein